MTKLTRKQHFMNSMAENIVERKEQGYTLLNMSITEECVAKLEWDNGTLKIFKESWSLNLDGSVNWHQNIVSITEEMCNQ